MNLTLPPGRPPTSACAHAQALARRTSWWLPGDLAAFASSPPGNKNSRGAPRLRQIEPGYNLLQQVRHGVTERRRTRTAPLIQRGHPEWVLGCVLSPRDLPRGQPGQTPQAAGGPAARPPFPARNGPDYADGEIRRPLAARRRERGTQPHVPATDRTARIVPLTGPLKAWMPQPRCWDDMNAASTPEARESGKNHKSQKFARSTVASGIAGVALDSRSSRPGRPPPLRPCACPGGGSGSGRAAGRRHRGPPSRR